MAGPPEPMAAENRCLDALRSARRVTVRDYRLIFTGEKSPRSEFARAKPCRKTNRANPRATQKETAVIAPDSL